MLLLSLAWALCEWMMLPQSLTIKARRDSHCGCATHQNTKTYWVVQNRAHSHQHNLRGKKLKVHRQVSRVAKELMESDLKLDGSCWLASSSSNMLSPSWSSSAVPDCAADASTSCGAWPGGCRVKAGLRGVPARAGCRLAADCLALLGGVLRAPARLRRKQSCMADGVTEQLSLAKGCANRLPSGVQHRVVKIKSA